MDYDFVNTNAIIIIISSSSLLEQVISLGRVVGRQCQLFLVDMKRFFGRKRKRKRVFIGGFVRKSFLRLTRQVVLMLIQFI